MLEHLIEHRADFAFGRYVGLDRPRIRASATPRPMPELAPVTSAFCPASIRCAGSAGAVD
jgi:hypothetical protein